MTKEEKMPTSHVARAMQSRKLNATEIHGIRYGAGVQKQFRELYELVKDQHELFDADLAECVRCLGNGEYESFDYGLAGLLQIGYEAAEYDAKKDGHQARTIIGELFSEMTDDYSPPDPNRIVVDATFKTLNRRAT
jgi:hypothetical protein